MRTRLLHGAWATLGLAALTAAPVMLPSAIRAEDDAPAQRVPSEDDNQSLFDRLDANKDGALTADEIPEDRKRMFDRALRVGDKDSDGKLTREEFLAAFREQAPRPQSDDRPETRPAEGRPEARPGARPGAPPGGFPQFSPEQLFRRLDANGDGKLTKEELGDRPFLRPIIERGDRNGDGVIDLEEFKTAMERMRAAFPGGTPPAPGSFPGSPGVARLPNRLFATLDVNGDGKLSAEEIENATASLKKLDRNSDGEITREELGIPEFPGRPEGRPEMRPDARRPEGARPEGARPEGARPAEKRPEAATDRPAEKRPEGDRPAKERPEGGKAIDFNPGELFRKLKEADKDGDGKLSRDEVPEPLRARFDKADQNGDGYLDRSELEALVRSLIQKDRAE